MKARDVMSLGAAVVRPDSPVLEAVRIMLQLRLSGLPVVDQDKKLVGMVTEGDLLRRLETETERRRSRWFEFLVDTRTLAEEYVRSRGRKVEEVMTRQPVSIAADTPLADAVALMERHRIKRLPVVRDGEVVGIVSRADLMRVLAMRLADVPQAPGDDLDIRRHILDELARRGWSAGGRVSVTVEDGKVELDGIVTDGRIRDAVRVAAENAPGARTVTDHIRVMPIAIGWT